MRQKKIRMLRKLILWTKVKAKTNYSNLLVVPWVWRQLPMTQNICYPTIVKVPKSLAIHNTRYPTHISQKSFISPHEGISSANYCYIAILSNIDGLVKCFFGQLLPLLSLKLHIVKVSVISNASYPSAPMAYFWPTIAPKSWWKTMLGSNLDQTSCFHRLRRKMPG